MKLDMTLACSRVEDVEPYNAYRMCVSLEDVNLSELVESYKSDLLEEFDISDLIDIITDKGYTVEEGK